VGGVSEPVCTCTELQRMTVCHDSRNEPHLVGCPRWGTPRTDVCPTCGHSTAPIWFGQPGSGDHSEDDGSCIACGPELGKRCAS
jgi:hypothetical protein